MPLLSILDRLLKLVHINGLNNFGDDTKIIQAKHSPMIELLKRKSHRSLLLPLILIIVDVGRIWRVDLSFDPVLVTVNTMNIEAYIKKSLRCSMGVGSST